ncbi:MAG: hypothetical protein QG594_1714 [Bacteroidota bacterium]|nr:hypothetical protein [Bacteroidota bacterium]
MDFRIRLKQLKSVKKFSEEKKYITKELVDTFILKNNLQQQLSI